MGTTGGDKAGPADACSNCGAGLHDGDRYCRRCGQRRLSPRRRLWPLVGEGLEAAFSVDNRLLRTLVLLLFRPGFLDREWQQGRRARYLSPVSVFLLANLVFFLAPSLSDFSVSLIDQVTLQPYSEWVAPQAEQARAASGLAPEDFAAAYQSRAESVAELMVILHVPLLALVSFALAVGRRSFLVDHVVSTLHFFAFLMLYFAQLPYLLMPLLGVLDDALGGRLPAWQIGTSLQLLYVVFMLRTGFGYPWWRVLPSAAVYIVALYWVHVFYRFVQFQWVLAMGPG